jgi:hypothetical protein
MHRKSAASINQAAVPLGAIHGTARHAAGNPAGHDRPAPRRDHRAHAAAGSRSHNGECTRQVRRPAGRGGWPGWGAMPCRCGPCHGHSPRAAHTVSYGHASPSASGPRPGRRAGRATHPSSFHFILCHIPSMFPTRAAPCSAEEPDMWRGPLGNRPSAVVPCSFVSHSF